MSRSGRAARTLVLSVVASMMCAGTVLMNAPVAHAAVIDAVVEDSVKVVREDGQDRQAHVWDIVRFSADWKLPDQAGHAGDTFSITVPAPFEAPNTIFDLKGQDGVTVYGTCEIKNRITMTCTLNPNVENKNNVQGTVWFNAQASAEVNSETVNVKVNEKIVKADLPGTGGITLNSELPGKIMKDGWFPGSDKKLITWRVIIPGSKVKDQAKITIDDDYSTAGSNLTLAARPWYPRFYSRQATPACWIKQEPASCEEVLFGNNQPHPRVKFTHDENADTIKLEVEGPFQEDKIYAFDYIIAADSDILTGSEFVNTAFVNGKKLSPKITKKAEGGGTGSGDTVGHLNLKKSIVKNNGVAALPAGTTFPVDYSYTFEGKNYTGTLNLNADGAVSPLSNLPNGAVVTLTEKSKDVAGYTFGDPTFSGEGVTDGGASSRSATVTIQGTKRLELTLANPTKKIVTPVSPTVTPGVCAPGSTTPSDPTVDVPTTEGIAYGSPTLEKAPDGRTVTVKVRATAKDGYDIDLDNPPAGWTKDGSSLVFSKTVDVPVCATPVVPVSPTITPGVCPVDSTTPSDPTVDVPTTEGIVYSAPKLTKSPDGRTVTVEVTATPASGKVIAPNPPAGWTLKPDGTATFSKTVDVPKCATPVVPVSPTITPGVCPVDSTTPSDPTVDVPATEGIVYSAPKLTKSADGKQVTVTVSATAEQGYVLNTKALPDGWSVVNGVVTFSKTVDVPECATPVVPVSPTIEAGVCPVDSDVRTDPKVNVPDTEGIEYSKPEVTVSDKGSKVVVKMTAKAKQGFVLNSKAQLPEGWTFENGMFVFTKTYTEPACATPVVPVSPTITPGVCPVDSTTPSDPTVQVPTTKGVKYSSPALGKSGDGKKITVTVSATAEPGYVINTKALPDGWILVDGVATFSKTIDVPECATPVVPIVPTVVAGVCPVDSVVRSEPTVTVHEVTGIEYSKPVISTSADGKKVTVTLTAKAKDGYVINTKKLPDGWKAGTDGVATFSLTYDEYPCDTPVVPVIPKITDSFCPADSTVPVPPKVELGQTPGIEYSKPEIINSTKAKTVIVKVTAKVKPGYVLNTKNLPDGWKVNNGVLTYTKEVKLASCEDKPKALPRTGVNAVTAAATMLVLFGAASGTVLAGRRRG